MRTLRAVAVAAALALPFPPAHAADPFDACTVFTPQDAEKALGTAAAGEPANPRARRPRSVLSCTYTGTKDGKALAAAAHFHFSRSDDAAQREFDEARFKLQTKPMLLPGAEAFWSGKTGQMHLRKGRAWVTLVVGPEKPNERELEPARKLAEILAAKL